jgi:membrane protease YdiL (CAAX protease family)
MEVSTSRHVITLRDGTRIEAASPEEVQRVMETHRGQIQSGSMDVDATKTGGARPLSQVSLFLTAVAIYVGWRERDRLRLWFPAGRTHVWIGLLGGAGLLLAGFFLEAAMRALGVWPEFVLLSAWRSSWPALFGLIAIVVAPIAEELYFRGRLFEAVRSRIGVLAAIAITSIVFAVGHGMPVLIPGYVLFGVALAGLRVWSGGLWAPMIAHAINNGAAFFMQGGSE